MWTADQIFEIKIENQTNVHCISKTLQYLVLIAHNANGTAGYYARPALLNEKNLLKGLNTTAYNLSANYKNRSLSYLESAHRDITTQLINDVTHWNKIINPIKSGSSCHTHSAFCLFPNSCFFSPLESLALKLINQTFVYFKEVFITSFPGNGPDLNDKPSNVTVIDLGSVSNCYWYSDCFLTIDRVFLKKLASKTLNKMQNTWNENKHKSELQKYQTGDSCRAPVMLCYTTGKCVLFCLHEFQNALRHTVNQLFSLWRLDFVILADEDVLYNKEYSDKTFGVFGKHLTRPMYIYCDLGFMCYSTDDIEFPLILQHLNYIITVSLNRIPRIINIYLGESNIRNNNGKNYKLCRTAKETACPLIHFVNKFTKMNNTLAFTASGNLTKGPYTYGIESLRIKTLNWMHILPKFHEKKTKLKPNLVLRDISECFNPTNNLPNSCAHYNSMQLHTASFSKLSVGLFACTLFILVVVLALFDPKKTSLSIKSNDM